jgi:hypothetical protein
MKSIKLKIKGLRMTKVIAKISNARKNIAWEYNTKIEKKTGIQILSKPEALALGLVITAIGGKMYAVLPQV